MRALRLFRSNPLPDKAQTPASRPDESGLLAFASESQGPMSPSPTSASPQGIRAQVVIGALTALVLLEAVPAALWVKGRLDARGTAEAPLAISTPPPIAGSVAPCDATTPTATAGGSTTPATTPPSSIVTAPAAPAAAPLMAGMLAVTSPVPMHVYTRGKLVGTTEADSIMLPVGTHDLLLENANVGFRVRRVVTVQAGRTSSVKLEVPNGTVHVNAVPWAEVWVDNQRAGETPIGNLQAPIGHREIVFRHPELGERKTTVLVTLKGPNRVSMDMRTK
jgi:hypothetical protein